MWRRRRAAHVCNYLIDNIVVIELLPYPKRMSRKTVRTLVLASLLIFSCGISPSNSGEIITAGPGRISKIAFGSCLHQSKPQPVWKGIERFNPELFIMMGDNVYPAREDLKGLRAAYEIQSRQPYLQSLLNQGKLIGTWDDHDYGKNDAGRELPFAAESKQLFLDFFKVPAGDPIRTREGVYRDFLYGGPGYRTQLLLLDLRSFRDPLLRRSTTAPGETGYLPHPKRGPTILGSAQWKWFEEAMNNDTELRIVVSSFPVLTGDTRKESWGDFPFERERLLEAIAKNPAKVTLILSGDRHRGEISRIDGIFAHPLYDITSSSLNVSTKRREEPNRYRSGELIVQDNFGTLEVDWKKYRPVVRASLRTISGEPARDVQISPP